jgi:hypothetical protein
MSTSRQIYHSVQCQYLAPSSGLLQSANSDLSTAFYFSCTQILAACLSFPIYQCFMQFQLIRKVHYSYARPSHSRTATLSPVGGDLGDGRISRGRVIKRGRKPYVLGFRIHGINSIVCLMYFLLTIFLALRWLRLP